MSTRSAIQRSDASFRKCRRSKPWALDTVCRWERLHPISALSRIIDLAGGGAAGSEARRTTIRTQVMINDGTRVPVDYAFRKTRSGDWKAFDVVIEGISYVTNYRNQVVAEIGKSNIDAVITRLEQQGISAIEPPDA